MNTTKNTDSLNYKTTTGSTTSAKLTISDTVNIAKESETKNDNSVEKSYDEYYESYLTPPGVISFNELDAIEKYRSLQTAYEVALGQFIEMADRIIRGEYYEPIGPEATTNDQYSFDIKLNKLKVLSDEFLNRIESTYYTAFSKELNKEYSANLKIDDIVNWDYPGDSGYGRISNIFKSGEYNINDNVIIANNANPVYEITLFAKQKDGTFSESNEIKLKIASDVIKVENNAIIIKEKLNSENIETILETPTFNLIKSNGELIWFGVPTNKFIDKDKEIVASGAHEQFVKEVNEGLEPFPELWIWHIEKAVGTTDFLDYDERGFVIAGGTILKEYQDLVEKIVKNAIKQGDILGMSHQMIPGKTYMQGNVYVKYVSKEFSLLPVKHAANELTGFSL